MTEPELWWQQLAGITAQTCSVLFSACSKALLCHAAAKFQAQQARQAGLDSEAGIASEVPSGTGSPRLTGQQRMSSLGGAAAMSAAAPSDVTGICGTGYYISVSAWRSCSHVLLCEANRQRALH